MLNFIPTVFSNKFSPGSPDCILSTKSAVNLQINAAFIKALIGSIIPTIFHGKQPVISYEGKNFSYWGAIDSQTRGPFGRGVAYEGSLLSPKTFEIGLFGENGELKEGFSYLRDEHRTAYIGLWRGSWSVNVETSNGEYVRGVVPRPQDMKTPAYSLPIPFSLITDKGLPLPTHGGEICGVSSDGIVCKGTFQPDGTFTGSLSLPDGSLFEEGVFSLKELPSGMISYRQISGIRKEIVNGIAFTMKLPVHGDQFEGHETFPNGGFKEGVFCYEDAPEGKGKIRKFLSGSFEISNGGVSLKGKMLNENTFEGRETFPNGAFRDGVFHVKNEPNGGLSAQQLSGTFELTTRNGSIYKGKILNEDTFEGQMISPNGSICEGIFSLNPSRANTGFFGLQISGTFKKIEKNGVVIEGEILGNDGNWKGSVTFPNGSFKNGVFCMKEKSLSAVLSIHLSGTLKMIFEDGSILEATLEGEGKGTGKIIRSDNSYIKGTVDVSKGDLDFIAKEEIIEYDGGVKLRIECDQMQNAILTYPNGDYKKGVFAGDLRKAIPSFTSGEVRETLPDGSILTGELDRKVFRGIKTKPDGTNEYVIA